MFGVEVNSWIDSGDLTVSWETTRAGVDPADRAQNHVAMLESIADHLAHGGGRRRLAHDFPLANLDASKLDKLAAVLGEEQS